jgi:hypothetical protein
VALSTSSVTVGAVKLREHLRHFAGIDAVVDDRGAHRARRGRAHDMREHAEFLLDLAQPVEHLPRVGGSLVGERSVAHMTSSSSCPGCGFFALGRGTESVACW